ncbi:MAG: ABC transporter ATP-binding protein [Salaquimonas sp.]
MALLDRIFSAAENTIDPFSRKDGFEPPRTLTAYIWFYVRQAKWAFAAMLVFAILNAGIEALVFTFVGEIVDILTAFDPSNGEGWAGLLALSGDTLFWMVAIALVMRIVIVIAGAVIEEQIIVPNFFTLTRWQGHSHIVGQSLSFFQNDLSGRIAQKVFQSGHAMGDLMIALIQTIAFISAYAITTFGLLISLNGWLGFFVIIWVTGFLVLARFFIPRIREHGRKTAEAGAIATGRMVDGYGNISTVKLHGATATENDWIKEGLKGQYNALRLFTRDLTGVRVSLAALSNLMVVVIAWQAIDLWLVSNITLGEVAFSLALVLRLSLLLNRLMGILNGFFRNIGTVQNSMGLIAQPLEITDKEDAKLLEFKEGKIDVDAIHFNYGKSGNLFDSLSLTIQPGEKIGIIGPSGAGKSTLVNLLLRFFDLAGGKIWIDGQDISQVQQDSLRAQFSMVQQDSAMFHRSVAENIAHGKPGASRDEIIEAAKKAKAHEFILSLEDKRGRKGYDAQVGERGIQLSGGQRQRIAIARVFLRDAPLLILDEATSQLDSGVEEAIQDNLMELMRGKTVIAIAHRLSTISAMDRLIILDQGKILEEGTHKKLLRKKGLYAKLWAKQSGGFIAD